MVRTLDPALFPQLGAGANSLAERIVRELRALIESGQLVPGDRLPSERDLARAFNVSRPSLREAMRRLAAVGLVEIRWGQGVYVRAADLDLVLGHLTPLMLEQGGIAELYDIRRLLEVAGAGWAAERATAEERAALRALTDEADAARDHLVADPQAAREMDERYHNLIAKASHNAVLLRVMTGLLDVLAAVRQRSFAIPGRVLRSLDEHRAVTDAIVAGDAAASREEMRAHLGQAEEAVRSRL
jgi:GntR family transcriptional repressor for pyruvate dehydrogenase complex